MTTDFRHANRQLNCTLLSCGFSHTIFLRLLDYFCKWISYWQMNFKLYWGGENP